MINGVSYVGNPIDNTAMYISKKVEYLVENLHAVKGCKVFVENSVIVPEEIENNNELIYTETPQKDYALFVDSLYVERERIKRTRNYSFVNGYTIGENVSIGKNSYIEPGAFIDHDVIIGRNAYIKSGAVLRNLEAGDNLIACENCTIGTTGFTMADDDNGNKIRIQTLGKVILGKNVEIGSLTNISCGSAGNTIFENNVKIDSLVHIGHDVYIEKNVEIPAGVIVGGFARVGENTFIGINSCIRNRKTVGKNVFVGMGTVVTKDIGDELMVVGNPARPFIKEK